MGHFEFVPHTADIALRVRGSDLAELLRHAVVGVAAAATDQELLAPHRAAGATPRLIESEGAPDEEGLLVSFLNEAIFQGEVNDEVYTDADILECSLQGGVRARLYPDPGLSPVRSIKAATYYGLHITSGPQGLEATIVFDV